ncbi:MAG: NAD-dependent epimerase/dehydratase family protein [Candidatus Omnitrophota bacterium]
MFYKGKVVLVAGGTGFVGSHIVQELLKADAKVRIPVHKRPLIIKDKRIETIKADLTIQEDCLKVLKGVDYIFHAAGSVGAAAISGFDSMVSIATNLILTAQMLQAAWQSNVERFLLFSSSTAYPPTDHPVKEEEMWSGSPHPTYSGYGWMRRYFEKLGEFVSSISNMKIAIVRPTTIYGSWDNFDLTTCHVIPALIRKAVEKHNPYEVWGSGEEVRDLLHVSDLARGCLLILEKYATCDPLNLGYGKPVKIKEVVQIILKAADHERAKVIFNVSKPSIIPFRAVDISMAKRILGFEPKVYLKEGLKDTVAWYTQTRNSLIKCNNLKGLSY